MVRCEMPVPSKPEGRKILPPCHRRRTAPSLSTSSAGKIRPCKCHAGHRMEYTFPGTMAGKSSKSQAICIHFAVRESLDRSRFKADGMACRPKGGFPPPLTTLPLVSKSIRISVLHRGSSGYCLRQHQHHGRFRSPDHSRRLHPNRGHGAFDPVTTGNLQNRAIPLENFPHRPFTNWKRSGSLANHPCSREII